MLLPRTLDLARILALALIIPLQYRGQQGTTDLNSRTLPRPRPHNPRGCCLQSYRPGHRDTHTHGPTATRNPAAPRLIAHRNPATRPPLSSTQPIFHLSLVCAQHRTPLSRIKDNLASGTESVPKVDNSLNEPIRPKSTTFTRYATSNSRPSPTTVIVASTTSS